MPIFVNIHRQVIRSLFVCVPSATLLVMTLHTLMPFAGALAALLSAVALLIGVAWGVYWQAYMYGCEAMHDDYIKAVNSLPNHFSKVDLQKALKAVYNKSEDA